jgi:hypothetical protein
MTSGKKQKKTYLTSITQSLYNYILIRVLNFLAADRQRNFLFQNTTRKMAAYPLGLRLSFIVRKATALGKKTRVRRYEIIGTVRYLKELLLKTATILIL